jgi:hypothetical protein
VFRSNKISLASANDIIDSLMESSEIMSGTGAVIITQKNGRKTTNTGSIYLRNGLIYAAHIENHSIPIGKRIVTGALVEAEDVNEVFRKVNGDTNSPRIVDYLLQNHMIGEKILSSYVKEHFIETLGKIMSWTDTLGEWHPNAVTNDFVMPFVTFDRIRQILAHRKHVYGEFLRLTEKLMRPEELPELTFSLLKSPADSQSPTTLKIISFCDGKNTIDDIANATGVTFYNVFQIIVGLWRDGLLTLNIGGIKLPYTAVLAEPEPEPVPAIVELTNPPIPVYEEVDEKSEAPDDHSVPTEEDSIDEIEDEPQEKPIGPSENLSDEYVTIMDDYNPDLAESTTGDITGDEDVLIVDPQVSENIPSVLADYAEENGRSFRHFTSQDQQLENDDAVENNIALYDPLKRENETPKVDFDSISSETNYVLPKDILDRRNKVEEINNKLNKLENNLANCEKELHANQITVGTLDERKTRLKNELAEVEEDYRRTLAQADNIRESYESIRKEVEDTINSFTFIEGE